MNERAPIRTLLVDDEYLALNLLEEFLKHLPDIEVVGKAKSAMAALDILHRTPVDLLFLDIQMPTLSGVNMLKTLQHPPVVVFTTAYADYAVQAFDLNAVDYLLKPFSFERFLQAVNKAKEHIRQSATGSRQLEDERDTLVIKVDGKLVKLHLADILFVEGLKEYVRFVCTNGKYVTLESLKNLEETLPAHAFVRVHKSYIVACNKVQSLLGNMLEIGSHRIPISREKKDEVVQLIFKQ
ncbi:MAG: response regulator transcription factor [Saprospiraceae bacterium]|nr:response regulator transcription factor [Saprospiraceae bacterium]